MTDFYKRRKNPWVGFVLVMLFAPFGFLYHSWKTALVVFFVAGPLWILFLRHTRFDLLENPWAHYIALLVLAGFAALQIKGQQHQMDLEETKSAEGAQILNVALSLLPNEVERKAFAEYLNEHPLLSQKFQNDPTLLFEPQDPFTRFQIALLLSSYGTIQGEAGDFSGASSSLLYSLSFFEENPNAWAGMAQVYFAWEDRIAIRWANKLLQFKPRSSTSETIKRIFSDTAPLATLQDMKEHMTLIIKVCSEHPEWRDSYPQKKTLPHYQGLSLK